MKDSEKPLVAIQCLVYNHEPYLRDCLNGFVSQKTTFPFVAIVHDDASSDNSSAIIQEYAERYPNIIKPIYEKENQWSKHDDSFLQIISKALQDTQCKYIAICEGDDYWIDPLKLQKQIDILNADPSLMACSTNSSIVDMRGNILNEKWAKPIVPNSEEGKYTLRDFFEQGHTYPTASVVYRRAHFDEISAKCKVMQNQYLGDWTLWIAILCYGDMYYLDDVTCAYRINPTSITHSKVDERRLGLAKANFKIIPAVASVLPDEYADIKENLIKHKAWLWFNLANAYKHLHQYFKMAGCLLICGLQDPKLLFDKIKNRKK